MFEYMFTTEVTQFVAIKLCYPLRKKQPSVTYQIKIKDECSEKIEEIPFTCLQVDYSLRYVWVFH